MKQRNLMLKLMAALMAFALFGAACGSGSDNTAGDATGDVSNESTETPEGETTTEAGIDTPAAGVVQTLTNQLAGHEYLAGIAITEGVLIGLDSPEFEAAAQALDNNSVELADTVGSVYGDDAREQFLDLWRKHIGFFVDYTKGQAAGDKKMAEKARQQLDGYRGDAGAFFESATEGAISKDAVAEALKSHTQSTFDAIDAVVGKKKGNPFELLRQAESHMPMIAQALSGAIVSSQGIEGSVDAPAVQLQTTLTNELASHEYLAGIAVAMGVQNGLDSDLFKLAAEALDNNSVGLADAVGSLYGEDARDQFLDLWRKHIGFFVDYTAAKASGDEKGAKKAAQLLDGYRSDAGAFFESATSGAISKDAVADALEMHVGATFDAIDAVVGAGDGNPFDLLREASNHMPMIASALAGAIAEDKNL